MSELISKEYKDFIVYEKDDKTSFVHIKLEDTDSFYTALFKYFFNFDNLIKYCENQKNIIFERNKTNLSKLCVNLELFIDEENEQILSEKWSEDLLQIGINEKFINVKEGKYYIRKDKIGRMGEYIFSNLLSDYFDFDCIIPKVCLATNRNMSVYGIDTVFYSSENKMLLFGESKFTNDIESGISLINRSLEDYEKSISSEFKYVFKNSNFNIKNCPEELLKITQEVITFKELIELADIKQIGIPIFIAHGEELEVENIIKKLERVNKKSLFDLETTFFLISLPVINKTKVSEIFTENFKQLKDSLHAEYQNC